MEGGGGGRGRGWGGVRKAGQGRAASGSSKREPGGGRGIIYRGGIGIGRLLKKAQAAVGFDLL